MLFFFIIFFFCVLLQWFINFFLHFVLFSLLSPCFLFRSSPLLFCLSCFVYRSLLWCTFLALLCLLFRLLWLHVKCCRLLRLPLRRCVASVVVCHDHCSFTFYLWSRLLGWWIHLWPSDYRDVDYVVYEVVSQTGMGAGEIHFRHCFLFLMQ